MQPADRHNPRDIKSLAIMLATAVMERSQERVEAAQLSGVEKLSFVGSVMGSAMVGSFSDDSRDDDGGASFAGSAKEEAAAVGAAPPRELRGLWSFEGGRAQVNIHFPLQHRMRGSTPLTAADLSESTVRLGTPSAVGSASPREGSEFGGLKGSISPSPVKASPRRSRHPAAWRTWSQRNQLQRPTTPDVLWPMGGKAFVEPPPLKRRKNVRLLQPLQGAEVKYKDEHVGYRTGNQAVSILADADAKRVVEEERQHRETYERLAARHAQGSKAFYTQAARAATTAPEIFPLRVVRREHAEQRVKERRLQAQRERLLAKRAEREKARAKVVYVRQRQAAIEETVRLPNVARPFVSWPIFTRKLLAKERRRKLGSHFRQQRELVNGAEMERWDEQLALARQDFRPPTPPALPIRFTGGQSDDESDDFKAGLLEILGADERPTTPMTPLRLLSRAVPQTPEEVEAEEGAAVNMEAETVAEAKVKVYAAYAEAMAGPGEHTGALEGRVDAVRHGFADECRKQSIAPLAVLPAPYLFGDKEAGRVDLTGKNVGNSVVVALARALCALPRGCKVQQLELGGNGLSSDAVVALGPVIERYTAGLSVIDLSGNRFEYRGCLALASALAGNIRLDELRLSGCDINDKMAGSLMPAIGECYGLEVVDLSQNRIGMMGAVAVAEMIERTDHLETFNLSWNQLRPHGCRTVIRALSENNTLLELGLAWNGAKDAVLQLEEVLSGEASRLQQIDLSSNAIGEREAQVMAGLLKRSKKLKHVVLRDNPVGIRGGRALCKALLVLNAHGTTLDLGGCNMGCTDKHLELFDAADPNGTYSLNLEVPYDEMVAYELVELAWLEEGENWQNEMLDGKKYELPEPEDLRIEFTRTDRLCDHFQLPEVGKLELEYSSSRRRPTVADAATSTQVDTFKVLMKESAMAAELALNIACSICYFTASQAIDFIEMVGMHAGDKIDAAAALLPRIIDVDKIPLVLNTLNDAELVTLNGRVGQDFFHFNAKNPTGSYKLDLSDSFDYLVASALVDFTNDEKMHCESKGLIDMSQHGNYSGAWRNETLNGEPFVYSNDFKLPNKGTLEFDYASTNRPSSRAEPLPNDVVQNLLADMAKAFNRVVLEQPEKKPKKKKRGSRTSTPEAMAQIVYPPATAEASIPDASVVVVKTAKRRLRRLSVGISAFGEDGDPLSAKAEPASTPEPEGAAVDVSDVPAGSAISHVEPAADTNVGAVAEALEPPGVTKHLDHARLLLKRGDHKEAATALEAATAAEQDVSKRAPLEELARRAAHVVSSGLRHVEHVFADDPFQTGGELVLLLGAMLSEIEDAPDPTAATAARAPRSAPKEQPRNATEKVQDAASMLAAASRDSLLNVGMKSEVKSGRVATGSAQLMKQLAMAKGERPPWHVPQRAKYVVTGSSAAAEEERRRLGTMLAVQILRRSTFLYYYSAEQICRVVRWFPRGHRVEALATLYARCIDIEKFYSVRHFLTEEETGQASRRLGALAMVNPYMPDGPYRLDLSNSDERKVALMLIYLAEGEPGENWQDEMIEYPNQEPRKLDITNAWTTDEGMPDKGIMSLTYVTNKHCAVPKLREKLAKATQIGENFCHLIPEELKPVDRPWLRNNYKKEKEFRDMSHI